MNGLGAWSYGFYHLGMEVPDGRVEAGIFAFKQELIYNGFADGIILELPSWGGHAVTQTKKFQASTGQIKADGVLGPTTARYLFAKRVHAFTVAHGIPGSLVGRQGTLESANDPVAQGYTDVEDEGWGQVHLPFHTEITQAQAWDPSFAIPWLGSQLVGARNYCDDDWDGGVAAYNVGWFYARLWVRAGKPARGLVAESIDWYARATAYVALVKAAKP